MPTAVIGGRTNAELKQQKDKQASLKKRESVQDGRWEVQREVEGLIWGSTCSGFSVQDLERCSLVSWVLESC